MSQTGMILNQLLDTLDEAYGELLADSRRDGPRCLLLTRIEQAIAAGSEALSRKEVLEQAKTRFEALSEEEKTARRNRLAAFVRDLQTSREQEWADMERYLNCPACGGSGHQDDANQKKSRDAIDAECFRFWVSEAARSPAAMAKLIMNCTTEQEYRDAILPIVQAKRDAILKATGSEA